MVDTYLENYWRLTLGVSIFCGSMLLLIVLALILSTKFRQDVISDKANPQNLKVLGFLGIKGTVVVALSALMLGGLLYPLIVFSKSVPRNAPAASDGDSSSAEGIHEVRDEIAKMRRGNESLVQQNTNLKLQLAEFKKSRSNWIPPWGLAFHVRKLRPDDWQSLEIRQMVQAYQGPWALPESKKVKISVPGDIKGRYARGCPKYAGHLVQLNSREGNAQRMPITVKVLGLIFRSKDCRKTLKYDLQLDCNDANKLLSDWMLTCDKQGQPLWSPPGSRLLKAYAADEGPLNSQ